MVDLSQLEIYLNVRAELEYLMSLPKERGGVRAGEEFFLAYDRRPSSTQRCPAFAGRGEILQAALRAVQDAGLRPVNLGVLPTPALSHYAWRRGRGGIMVTGSHIPFDRNGYKTLTATGELSKEAERPIETLSHRLREHLLAEPFEQSLFDEMGMFKTGSAPAPAALANGVTEYRDRYLSFFGAGALAGCRVVLYEHSAAGREVLRDILSGLGAEVIAAGRSEDFVAVDTEAVDEEMLSRVDRLLAAAPGGVQAVISTDGDSDRPLFFSIEPRLRRIRFEPGERLGLLAADFLGADAAVAPVSCSDAIEIALGERAAMRTRIGSPFVIAGLQRESEKGRQRVVGFEANGGFLTGSDIAHDGRTLPALPTRDAALPILCALAASRERGLAPCELFDTLPRCHGASARLADVPRQRSRKALLRFYPARADVIEIRFSPGPVAWRGETGEFREARPVEAREYSVLREAASRLLSPVANGASVTAMNFLDGVRIRLSSGEAIHLRASGNADELRIYAQAQSIERAAALAAAGVQEPGGILRRLLEHSSQGEAGT
ncbi:MAG: phosphomannomutase [Myxococcales bacterium]|nr:phosphomannomutase [Myxococcales bacterium]